MNKLSISPLTVHVASLQVIRYDAAAGKLINEAPFRWYDGAIPYDYPEFEGRVAVTNGATEKRTLNQSKQDWYKCPGLVPGIVTLAANMESCGGGRTYAVV